MRLTPPHALLPTLIALSGVGMAGCNSFDSVPRGADSLLQVLMPQTSPAEAADMALDEFSPENRYRGITMLSSADFGGEPVYIDLYVSATDDPDPSVRAAAIRALGRHGDPIHASLLIDALDEESEFVRVEAARALQRVHSGQAIDPLIARTEEANETDVDVRAAAADALGQYRESRVVLALIGALRDPRLSVNHRVRQSLRTLTGQDFGLDRSAWIQWYNSTEDLFAGARPYTYPVFNREKRIIEYLPLIPPPPNETPSTPVGMDPVIES